jgi:hypothetical protein
LTIMREMVIGNVNDIYLLGDYGKKINHIWIKLQSTCDMEYLWWLQDMGLGESNYCGPILGTFVAVTTLYTSPNVIHLILCYTFCV